LVQLTDTLTDAVCAGRRQANWRKGEEREVRSREAGRKQGSIDRSRV
jgi:hypothetical protein